MKIIIASTVLLAGIPAWAGTVMPALTKMEPVTTTSSNWQVRAALYGWGTSLDGEVTLHGNKVPVDVAFTDVFENLDLAVMGVLEIGNGKWSFLADFSYAELSVSNARRNLEFKSELNQFIGNFVIACNVLDHPDTRFDVYAGARVNSLDASLEVLTDRKGVLSGSDSKAWLDPVIGVRVQQELPSRFFLRALGDIGGFGVSSDITWQALGMLGYHINDSAAVTLGYRGVGTDYENARFGYDVTSHGLLLGFEYKF